jgi:zinc transport system ATP-binding protein
MQIDHTKNIIEVKNVSFSYSGEEVLSYVSLNVHKGDYIGLIGPNGGGKTTLLKIMLGLLKPDEGSVRLFGTDLTNFKDRYKLGYVPQKANNFDPNFPITVEEVVAMGRYGKKGLFRGLNSSDQEIIKDSLEKVNMWKYRSRIIGDLSGGQQQRVFIARALASQPEVILLDEPTIGVDVETQEQFYKLLQKLNKEFEITLILVSHDINVVANETTEVAYVNKTLIYDANPKDLLEDDSLEKTYGKKVKLIAHHH